MAALQLWSFSLDLMLYWENLRTRALKILLIGLSKSLLNGQCRYKYEYLQRCSSDYVSSFLRIWAYMLHCGSASLYRNINAK